MGRFAIARGFIGGALAMAAVALVILFLVAAFQYRDEVRNDRAAERASPAQYARP
jgi:hypothetical protein